MLSMCIVALVVIIIHLQVDNELISKDAQRWFSITALVISVEILLDILATYLSTQNSEFILFHRMVKAMEFSIAPLMPIIPMKVVSTKNFLTKTQKLICALFFCNLSMQLVNVFVPIVFEIDAKNVYHRKIIGYLYLVILVILAVLLIVSFYKSSKKIQFKNRTLVAIIFLILIGIFIRLVSNCNVDFVAISFAFFILIISYCDMHLKVDPLTQLLNRRVYDIRENVLNYSTIIILLDANNFKRINDTCGHYYRVFIT